MSYFNYSWRLLPLIVVLIGFAAAKMNLFANFDAAMLRNMPYFLGVVLLMFASMFNRSRFMAPIIITLLTYFFIRERLQAPLNDPSVMALFIGVNLLFCIQLVFSAIVPEKGMFNRMGGVSISILLIASALLWEYGAGGGWVDELSSLSSIGDEKRYWVTDVIFIGHAACLVSLGLIMLIRKSVSDYALLITWLCGALVFYDFALSEVSSICFSALLIALFIVYQQSNYQVTYMDALTGIPGRRSLDDYLSTLGRKYTIAMLDVDHFKKFNDTYGHDVGDQVLKMVASKISQVEGGGKAFRYGGEEFTIIFNRRTANDAFVFLEAVRESIQNYEMTLRSDDREDDRKEGKKQRGKSPAAAKKVSVTISVGVANSASGLAPNEVIKLADENLYRAKDAGRNCTIRPE